MSEKQIETGTDPLLQAAFDQLRRTPHPEVDWDDLRSTINDRAALSLARRRSRRVGRIPRQLVPLAVAAGLAFAIWLGPGYMADEIQREVAVAEAHWDEEEILAQALGDLSDQEFRLLVSGRNNPEELLAFVLDQR